MLLPLRHRYIFLDDKPGPYYKNTNNIASKYLALITKEVLIIFIIL